MRARFFLRPLRVPESQQRGTEYQTLESIEITDRIIRAPIIHTRIDRDKWSWGVSSSGDLRLSLADPDGFFTPASNPRSVFNYAGMKGAVLTIAYPLSERDGAPGRENLRPIWRGYLTEKDTQTRPQDGISTILARTADAVLRESSFPATSVFDNASALSVLRAIWAQQTVRLAMGDLVPQTAFSGTRLVGDPTMDGIIVPNVADLFPDGPDATRSLDVIQDIMQMTDSMVIHRLPGTVESTSSGTTAVARRGGGVTSGDLADVISIDEISEGAEQIYNRIIITTGVPAPDHVVQADSAPSQRKHGLRVARINGRWLRNVASAREIAADILRRLARPRRRLVLTTTPWALHDNVTIMQLGLNIGVHLPVAPVLTAPLYGAARYGQSRYQETRYQPYSGRYWIEQLRWNPDVDTVQIEFRER